MIIQYGGIPKKDANLYSPITLAYIGDCVYELLVREALVLRENRQSGKLHAEAVTYVNAKGQSDAFSVIESLLTDEEAAIFRRGRNSHASPNKNNDPLEYKRATGLEALFGYLWLCGEETRLRELFSHIIGREEEKS